MKYKNVSSQGDLELPLIRRVVLAGEVVEVTAEQGVLLADQADVWQPIVEKDGDKK